MNEAEDDLIGAFELHDAGKIRASLSRGIDPRAPLRGKLLTTWLTEMYTRSDRFPGCLRTLLDAGAALDDPVLAPVLLDDGPALTAALAATPTMLQHRTTMTCAFTPLDGASLLHVAAEFGNLEAARALLAAGAAVDARAAIDEHGLGGHSALFHTVNQNGNRPAPILRLLLDAGADAMLRVHGLTWGRGFDWETTWFDLTPIGYAQLGLLPQVHRDAHQIHDNVHTLLRAAGRTPPPLRNVPNRYLGK